MYIENIAEKGETLLVRSNSSLIHNILLPNVKRRTRFSLRDKRLFEIIEVEISRVDCRSICLEDVRQGRPKLLTRQPGK